MLAGSAARSVEIIHEKRSPLLVLESYDLSVDAALLAAARRELLRPRDGGGSHQESIRSGFLLGMEARSGEHPACLKLASELHARMLGEFERDRGLRFSLSFYKLLEGAPPKVEEGPLFEGPHLDSHPGLTDSTELLRLLVNLSEHPRRFLYSPCDRWWLEDHAVCCGRREFVPLKLPPDAETRVVRIPGRTRTKLHALKFFASAIPHVGLNDPPEHFLISFETLTNGA